MLRRDRLIRMHIHELMDACLFALSFWLAYVLRSDPDLTDLLGLLPVSPVDTQYVWLYLVLIPAAPMVLEAQGFYNRPLLCSRRWTAWLLFKGCCLTALGLILAVFCFQIVMARGIILWFAGISFTLVFIKEELLSLAFKSKLAQAQYRRRFILVGTADEKERMRTELKTKSPGAIEILAEMDLNQMQIGRLVEMLHEFSVNGVILSAKHSYFEQVEAVIRACELEGVEAWLVADFFKMQISRTSFAAFYGRPVLVFRSVPEASWQGLCKQVLDFVGALLLLM